MAPGATEFLYGRRQICLQRASDSWPTTPRSHRSPRRPARTGISSDAHRLKAVKARAGVAAVVEWTAVPVPAALRARRLAEHVPPKQASFQLRNKYVRIVRDVFDNGEIDGGADAGGPPTRRCATAGATRSRGWSGGVWLFHDIKRSSRSCRFIRSGKERVRRMFQALPQQLPAAT
jgi:hypothetical protein